MHKLTFASAFGLRTGAALSVVAFSAVTALGAGFALEDGSARGNVTPGQLTARGDLPSSLYFNAATITDLPGTQMEIGFTGIKPSADVTMRSPYDGTWSRGYGDSSLWTLPTFYLTSQLTDSLWFGFGVFTRFGLGAEFEDTWAGRYNSTKAEILSLDFNPNLAWKVTDRLSLSIGFSIRYFDIELCQMVDAAGAAGLRSYNDPSYSPYDVKQRLHGDDIAPVIDLGLTYKLTDTLTLGLAYHSQVKMTVKGDAEWVKPPAVQAMAPAFFNDTGLRANNFNPDKFMVGLAWDATEKLTLSAGATCTLWHLYDTLTIRLDEPMLAGRSEISSKKGWNDAWRVNFGAEYEFNDSWAVRAGYQYDMSPINSQYADYLVPGDDRHIFALGVSWTDGKWTVDASYFYEIVEDFTVKARPERGVFEGEYTGADAHAFALSLTRAF